MKIAVWFLGASTLVLGFLAAKFNWENTRLLTLEKLQNRQIELMRDECQDLQFKLSTNPSYEDGYKAALLKRNNGSYSDGYEDAKLVYDSSNNYALGYHAAINQFGFLQDLKKETAAKIDPASAEKKEEEKTY